MDALGNRSQCVLRESSGEVQVLSKASTFEDVVGVGDNKDL